jgi:signal transduction histidine kinase
MPARGFSRLLLSLRLRFAVFATLLAAVAFTVGGTVALVLYRDSLVSAVNNGVLQTAQEVAATASSGPLPDPIPMPVAAAVPRIQILDSTGRVKTGDPASVSDPPILTLAAGQRERLVTVSHPANLPDARAAIVALRTTSPGGAVTVVVAGSLDAADAKVSHAIMFSSVAGGISLAMVAIVAWLTAGRTLRRVDRLCGEVAAITARGADGASGAPARRVLAAGSDELARLGSTLNQMLDSLARTAERQRRFVADAAHELRTPIAGLAASVEVAASQPQRPADDGFLTEQLGGLHALGHLVNDLLVLAALDGHAPARHRPVDLSGVVADCVRLARTPSGVRIRADDLPSAVVGGDESQLSRIVANLIDNALRHARAEVAVDVVIEAGQVVVTVSDDGLGIPVADRERVWERFARLDDDRSRDGGGTGLGLALVRELAEAHGGTAAVTGSQSGGARFEVSLPLASIR